MSTYKELFDDFRQKVSLYTEKVEVTEPMFMRLLTAGINDFQNETRYVEATKDVVDSSWWVDQGAWNATTNVPDLATPATTPTLGDHYVVSVAGSTDLSGITTWAVGDHVVWDGSEWFKFTGPTNLGDDVLQVIEIYDENSQVMQMKQYTQFKQEIEVAGFFIHEGPQWWGWRREYEAYREDWGYAATIFTVFEHNLLTYPTQTPPLSMRYILDLHMYTPGGTQWTAWGGAVGNTAFGTQFTTTGVRDELVQFERGFVEYAVSEYLQTITTQMVGDNPAWKIPYQKYRAVVDKALQNKQVYFTEAVAPYRLTPFNASRGRRFR